MEFILLVVWVWGSYEGWKKLTAKNNEWLNTKAPLNIIVKVALCVVLGLGFAIAKWVQISLYIIRHLPLPF